MPKDWKSIPTHYRSTALRDRAWHAIEPHYLARWRDWSKCSGRLDPRPGADDLAQGVADAAAAGRSERCSSKRIAHIPGCIDAVTGEIELDDLADDLLDGVGELVLENRSQNCKLCLAERMPPHTGCAIYRY